MGALIVRCACGRYELPDADSAKIIRRRNTHMAEACIEFTKGRYCERPKPTLVASPPKEQQPKP